MPTTPTPRPRENFLADAVGPRERKLTYLDGFRFGLGLVVAHLLILCLVAGLAWGLIMALHLH